MRKIFSAYTSISWFSQSGCTFVWGKIFAKEHNMRRLFHILPLASLTIGMLLSALAGPVMAAPLDMKISPIQQLRGNMELNSLQSARFSCASQDIAALTICNTANQCNTANFSCFPYRCDASARTCGTSCSGNAQCWDGAVCNGGRCVIQRSFCEGNIAKNTAGASTSCSPYACDAAAGACKNRCTITEDCSGTFVCSNSQCVPPIAPR